MSAPGPPDMIAGRDEQQLRRRQIRRRWIAAAFAVVLAADVAAATSVGLTVGRQRHDQARSPSVASPALTPSPAPTETVLPAPLPSPTRPKQSPSAQGLGRAEALTALLDIRARALLAGDRRGWLAGIDPSAAAFRTQQDLAFDGIRQLPIGLWTYQVRGAGPALNAARTQALGGSSWVAEVVLRYRIDGFDAVPVRRVLYLTAVQRGARWLLAGDADGPAAESDRDIWDLGPIHTARGKFSLVVGRSQLATRLKAYAAEVDRAVVAVTRVWGPDWSRRVVLLVPRTQAEMGRLLDSDGKGLDQIAAVTTGQLVTGSPGAARRAGPDVSADRVVLNTTTFTTLGPVGRNVVLTHEVTHVATRQSGSAAPSWLAEGFADYMGYLTSAVPVRIAAEEVLDNVREGDLPNALPGDADFDPSKGAIASAYEGAWLACRLIAELKGQPALVRFYRIASGATGLTGGAAVAAAFRQVLGDTQAQFTARWRAELKELAGP